MRRLGELFWSFLKIGLFTFGGGYAMIPLISREVCERKGWIEQKDFLDLLTLAQSAPGPISLNTSVFVGYKLAGYPGALAAVLGVVLPSFSIILAVAVYFSQVRENPVVDAAFKGMRPAVVALILAPVLSLAKGMGWQMLVVVAASALAIWLLNLSPVLVICLGAAGGIGRMLLIAKKGRR